MRLIGSLDSEERARRLAAALYDRGIECQVDPGADGRWELWVLHDDDRHSAQAAYERFHRNPEAEEFIAAAQAGRRRLERDRQQARPRRARVIDARLALQRPVIRLGPVTLILIVLSIAVTVRTRMGQDDALVRWLTVTAYRFQGDALVWDGTLPEIRRGQLWRLWTPMFLHFNLLHILFNMLWLKDLGSLIESLRGSWYLLLLTAVIAAISNIAQFFVSGPMFGGMSGVVYGLLGYLWMTGKFHPRASFRLNPHVVQMMIVWFFLCLTGLMGPVANTAHGVGALAGMAWGTLAALWARHH